MFDPERPLNTPLNGEGLVRIPFPKLDKYDFEVAQLMANIYTCSRELAHRNLTDNEHFTLDKAVDEMVDCVNRFEDRVRELIRPAPKKKTPSPYDAGINRIKEKETT